MKIFADLRWPDNTGIGVVKNELLRRLPIGYQVEPLRVDARIGSPLSTLALAFALRRQNTHKEGLFWSPGFVPPAFASIPAVVTAHDLLHLHYYSRLHVEYYNRVFRPLYRKCRAIICGSDFAREEFLDWSGFPPERCHTVYWGVSSAFGQSSTNMPQLFTFPYVLYPGNRRAYKNISRLLEAYSRSRLPGDGIEMVFTGDRDSESVAKAAAFGISEHLHFAGILDQPALVRLYREARIVAFISLYEGFGLPIVEAMASGVPVLTSNTTSMPEVAGDAALLIEPDSVDAISAGLELLAFNQITRQSLVQRGAERALKFNWDLATAKVWRILEQAALD